MDVRSRTVEGVVMDGEFWRGRKVFVTGHTGFKGGWLSLWLSRRGAEVYGYSLAPPTNPSFYSAARVAQRIAGNTIADLRDFGAMAKALAEARPSVVFHLAAQSLVRRSYIEPVETYEVNVIGTVNLLEAIRKADSVRAIVNVTSDKCYENREWVWPYRETEPMGGVDPYSSSKGCSELVTSAYRRSFFETNGIRLASGRAGNVIGGGDWASDRLVPDCVRAFSRREAVRLRHPEAVRPWQHVLEPLAGYLRLAEKLYDEGGSAFGSAWNFGPDVGGEATVGEVAEEVARLWGQGAQVERMQQEDDQRHEAGLLRIDSSRARSRLHWRPRWQLGQALEYTVAWYRAFLEGADMLDVSLGQIQAYEDGGSGL